MTKHTKTSPGTCVKVPGPTHERILEFQARLRVAGIYPPRIVELVVNAVEEKISREEKRYGARLRAS